MRVVLRVTKFPILGELRASGLDYGKPATSEREITPLPFENVTPKNGEDLGGLCLEVHHRFS
jgi:hypothetical protein